MAPGSAGRAPAGLGPGDRVGDDVGQAPGPLQGAPLLGGAVAAGEQPLHLVLDELGVAGRVEGLPGVVHEGRDRVARRHQREPLRVDELPGDAVAGGPPGGRAQQVVTPLPVGIGVVIGMFMDDITMGIGIGVAMGIAFSLMKSGDSDS